MSRMPLRMSEREYQGMLTTRRAQEVRTRSGEGLTPRQVWLERLWAAGTLCALSAFVAWLLS